MSKENYLQRLLRSLRSEHSQASANRDFLNIPRQAKALANMASPKTGEDPRVLARSRVSRFEPAGSRASGEDRDCVGSPFDAARGRVTPRRAEKETFSVDFSRRCRFLFCFRTFFPLIRQGRGTRGWVSFPLSFVSFSGSRAPNLQTAGIGLVALTALLLFSSCVTGEKIGRVQPGMSQATVREILGRPDGFRVVNGCEVYQYSNRRASGWNNDHADYNVVFRDDRVIEYGAGEVRPGPRPQTVVLFPMRGLR